MKRKTTQEMEMDRRIFKCISEKQNVRAGTE
jgi:hypothetical protein